MTATTPPSAVASYRHTLGLIGIAIVVAALGAMAQARPTTGAGLTNTHASALPAYLSAFLLEAALLYYVWAGVRKRGVTLAMLSGGRWSTPKDVLRDFAIALPFWALLQLVDLLTTPLVGSNNAKSVNILLPVGWFEVSVWILLSLTAGFVEELVFRGYLQRQLLALSGRTSVAVCGQAAVFGLMHAYQGWRLVSVICLIGLLFGLLAAWLRSTRPGMMAHALTDIWGGWLKSALHFSPG
jgi:membrane protease YdiL (CAAX protease family)